MVVDSDRLEELAQTFEVFAVAHFNVTSPLYAALSSFIAGDKELVALAGVAASRPVPNLFLGAAHYLLLRDPDERLQPYYPSLGGSNPPDPGACAAFKEFCLSRRGEMELLLRQRRVQTSEVAAARFCCWRSARSPGGRPAGPSRSSRPRRQRWSQPAP